MAKKRGITGKGIHANIRADMTGKTPLMKRGGVNTGIQSAHHTERAAKGD